MSKASATTGIIRPGELLTREAAMVALKVEDWGWREIKKKGLPIIKQGRRFYVLSDDLIAFFARLRDEQE